MPLQLSFNLHLNLVGSKVILKFDNLIIVNNLCFISFIELETI